LLSKGDLRKSINFLQSLSLQSNNLTLELCYKIAGVPSIEEVVDILTTLLNNKIDYNSANTKIDSLIKSNGYSLSIVLKELVSYLLSNKLKNLDPNKLAIYLSEMADLENRVTKSTFGDIYMTGLVGIFKKN
jgi:DNA polymerase III delta prime subunit